MNALFRSTVWSFALLALFSLVVWIFGEGCAHPWPKPAPCFVQDAGVEDAGDTSDMTASVTRLACGKLADAGCEEGKDKSCAGKFARAIREHAVPPSLPVCVTEAKDVAGFRSCGVRCGAR